MRKGKFWPGIFAWLRNAVTGVLAWGLVIWFMFQSRQQFFSLICKNFKELTYQPYVRITSPLAIFRRTMEHIAWAATSICSRIYVSIESRSFFFACNKYDVLMRWNNQYISKLNEETTFVSHQRWHVNLNWKL